MAVGADATDLVTVVVMVVPENVVVVIQYVELDVKEIAVVRAINLAEDSAAQQHVLAVVVLIVEVPAADVGPIVLVHVMDIVQLYALKLVAQDVRVLVKDAMEVVVPAVIRNVEIVVPVNAVLHVQIHVKILVQQLVFHRV